MLSDIKWCRGHRFSNNFMAKKQMVKYGKANEWIKVKKMCFFAVFAQIFIKLAAEKRKQNEKYLKNRIKNGAEKPNLAWGVKTRVKSLKKRL